MWRDRSLLLSDRTSCVSMECYVYGVFFLWYLIYLLCWMDYKAVLTIICTQRKRDLTELCHMWKGSDGYHISMKSLLPMYPPESFLIEEGCGLLNLMYWSMVTICELVTVNMLHRIQFLIVALVQCLDPSWFLLPFS